MAVVLACTLNVSVYAVNVTEYKDVPKTHWAYAAIMEMTNREMFSGTSTPAKSAIV